MSGGICNFTRGLYRGRCDRVIDLGLSVGSNGSDLIVESVLAWAERDHMSVHDLEERYIEQVLGFSRGSKLQASKILKIDRNPLYRRPQRIQETGV